MANKEIQLLNCDLSKFQIIYYKSLSYTWYFLSWKWYKQTINYFLCKQIVKKARSRYLVVKAEDSQLRGSKFTPPPPQPQTLTPIVQTIYYAPFVWIKALNTNYGKRKPLIAACTEILQMGGRTVKMVCLMNLFTMKMKSAIFRCSRSKSTKKSTM